MPGKPGSTKPVFCRKVAGPCTFDFETIEYTKAISSAQPASCGSSPLIQRPDSPCRFQSQGLFITVPGLLWKSSTAPPGSNFCPSRLISSGL